MIEEGEGSALVPHSAIDLYFLQQDGHTFKATIRREAYFYIACKVSLLSHSLSSSLFPLLRLHVV